MVKEEMNEEDGNDPVIKMRGLPWSATVDDIINFLEEANIKGGRHGVHITMSREGRPSGEAFIELETMQDVEKALRKNKNNMGHRYIEIFKTSKNDMEWFLARSGSNVENITEESCIRLRGLPYGCTKNDIIQFFSGLTIVPNGISFVSDQTGRNTGEAYVQFVNNDMVESALKKHLDKIGHRYIEIFRSSLAEIRSQTGPKIRPLMSEMVPRPSPYDRGDRFRGPNRMGRSNTGPPPPARSRDYSEDDDWESNTGTGGNGGSWGNNLRKMSNPRDASAPSLASKNRLSPPPAARMRNLMYGNGKSAANTNTWDEEEQRYIVHMRGLPYKATEQDIMEFFRPLIPVNVQIMYERAGRPSGEANVEFQSYDDASRAMAKDKQNINNRYIELFLKATPPSSANKPSSLSGRSLSGRSQSGYNEDSAPEPLLFSRRPTSSGSAPVSNSAYDGFYGTSLYRAAANAGGGKRF